MFTKITIVALIISIVSSNTVFFTDNYVEINKEDLPLGEIKTPIITEHKDVSNVNCKIVTVDSNDKTVEFKVATGNNGIIGAESFNSIINRTGAKAAINANFFDAYKSLAPMNTIIKDGKIIHLSGNSGLMAVFKDGSIKFGKFPIFSEYAIKDKVFFDKDKRNTGYDYLNYFKGWEVNKPNPGVWTIGKFTPLYGSSINLSKGLVMEVRKEKIINVSEKGGLYNIPSDGYLVYFGEKSFPKERIEYLKKNIGSFIYTRESAFEEDKKTISKDINLSEVHSLISAAPLLILNGKIVVDEEKLKVKEAKIHSHAAQRSAIGITADGKIKMVSCVATVDKLAQMMKELGCTDALNLDGGASSALYGNGKMLQNPGRKLNTVLTVALAPLKAKDIAVNANSALLSINGMRVNSPSYLINGNNYFKIRDITYLINEAGKKINIEWDGERKMIELKHGEEYLKNGKELEKTVNQSPISTEKISELIIDGKVHNEKSYVIDNSTYFKLTNLSELMDFDLSWDRENKTIIINTR